MIVKAMGLVVAGMFNTAEKQYLIDCICKYGCEIIIYVIGYICESKL